MGACAAVQPGTLTFATANPAPAPWFIGTPGDGSPWADNDPSSGRGFESALAYDIARRMGYDRSEVQWIAVPFSAAYAPGPKMFDAYIGEVTRTAERMTTVDFSPPYLDSPYAVLVRADSPVASAPTRDNLRSLEFGSVVGTTLYGAIEDVLDPVQPIRVFDEITIMERAMAAGQVDAIVLDLQTAVDAARTRLPGTKVAALLREPGPVPALGVVTQKDGPMSRCIRDAITAMRRDGTLRRLEQRWVPSPPDLTVVRSG